MKSVCSIDANNIIAVGECGVMIKTSNGGINWNVLQLDTSDINCVYFVNNLTGWLAGGVYAAPNMSNIIMKTTNAGENWIKQQSNLSGYELNSIFFLDAALGFAVGGTFGEGKVIKTTNGGSSWIELNISANREFRSLFFINSNTGWVGGDGGKLAMTSNGGNDWIFITGLSGNIVSISFTDSFNGFASRTPGNTYRTTNGGMSWDTISYGGNYIFFTDQYTGWINGPSVTYKTTDAGNNWFTYNYVISERVNSFDFTNSLTGWAVGGYGTLQKTTNGGINWFNELQGFSFPAFGDAYFLNNNTGYVVGGELNIPTPYGLIYKTTDGGNNWNNIFAFSHYFSGIDFVNSSTGWLCGTDWYSNSYTGVVMRSTDGGSSWNQQYVRVGEKFIDIHFFDQNTGFVVGYTAGVLYGTIHKTTNGGLNWSFNSLGNESAILDSYFLDVNTGWVGCLEGKVFQTTNSGANWIQVPTGLSEEIRSIYFLNYQRGWICTLNGMLYSTTNSGNTWVNQYNVSYLVTNVNFVNDSLGWAATSGGEILYTTNLGTNWNVYPRTSYNGIDKIIFLSSETGWLLGNRGILKTTNGGGILGVIPTFNEMPETFSLSQNYPNPFNPVTNIKFDLAVSGFVKLTIYDLLGREITTLVNQQMQAGSYSADWDASSYPSGVYFYKLVAGENEYNKEFTETRKMVLIK